MLKSSAAIMLVAVATAVTPQAPAVDRTAAYLESIRTDPNPTRLTEFLADIPKGGDLHHHLSGAVYAELY